MRQNFKVKPPKISLNAARKPNRIRSTTLVSWINRPENAKNGYIWCLGAIRHLDLRIEDPKMKMGTSFVIETPKISLMMTENDINPT